MVLLKIRHEIILKLEDFITNNNVMEIQFEMEHEYYIFLSCSVKF